METTPAPLLYGLPPLKRVSKASGVSLWVGKEGGLLPPTPFRLPNYPANQLTDRPSGCRWQDAATKGFEMKVQQQPPLAGLSGSSYSGCSQFGANKGNPRLNGLSTNFHEAKEHRVTRRPVASEDYSRGSRDNGLNHVITHPRLTAPQAENIPLSVKVPFTPSSRLVEPIHEQNPKRLATTDVTSSECLPAVRRKNPPGRSKRPVGQRKASLFFSDVQSLPAERADGSCSQDPEQNELPVKSKRFNKLQTVPSVTTKTQSRTQAQDWNQNQQLSGLNREPKQLKYFVQNFNNRDVKSLQSVSTVNSKDLPSIQERKGSAAVPKWFLGSVAHSENMDVARSAAEDFPETDSGDVDPDLADVTDAQEFYESYKRRPRVIKYRENSSQEEDDTVDDSKPVWRTLPMQGELQKYLHYLRSGKGLDQKFSKYVGPIVPGKYRSGGPISRPKPNTKVIGVTHVKPLDNRQNNQTHVDSGHSGKKQMQEMNRMGTRMTTMLND